MVERIFTRQFAKDGLVGIFVAVTVSVFLTAITSGVLAIGGLLGSFIEFVSSLPVETVINPLPFMFFVAFVGSGIGGLVLEKAITKSDWAGSMLLTLLFICGIGIIASAPFMAIGMHATNPLELLGAFLFSGLFSIQIIFPGSVFTAVLWFFPLWLVAVIMKPEKRISRVLIGAFASSALAMGMSSMMLVMQIFFA